MIQRIWIFLKERHPLFSRTMVSVIIFFEIYFLILLNFGVTNFSFGVEEFVGAYTVFAFLLLLRIADDLKDYETDKILFPERPLADGRVHKKDILFLLGVTSGLAFLLNVMYMNNLGFFFLLYTYGFFMSMWFFQKAKIENSLPLALVTHNPVQMVLNIYIISFTLIKYNLPWAKPHVFLAALTLYFPALIWEISRKIRAPQEETEYTTYSKLFGVQRTVRFVAILTIIDAITNMLLVWNLNQIAVIFIVLNLLAILFAFVRFTKQPTAFQLIKPVEIYTLILEALMLISIVIFLVWGPMTIV